MATRRPSSSLGAWSGAFVLLVLVARPLFAKAAIRNSSRECAICHIRWVEALERGDAQESLMQGIIDQRAGSGDMCLSCHDGSVADSRFKVWSTRHHTTDSVPSPAVRIPTDKFPLDAQGRMTCATCHTAHAVPDSSDLATVIFLRQPNIDSSLCLSCHPEHARKNDFQHPLGHTDSPVPQEILEAGGKTSPDGHTIICQTCHEPHGARNAWMLVLPPSRLCIACHTDKSPETAPPAGAPVHHIGRAYPGFEPPATLLGEKATFGPSGELTCLSCHRLHDASGAKPLLIRKNEDSSLCLECHKKEKAVLGSPHDLRVSSPETVNAADEKASASGPCGSCHRIHGWARDVPDTNRPHSSGCMECHGPEGPGSRNRPYMEAHPVGIPMPEGKVVPLPLDQATGSIGCLTCHDPHAPRSLETVTEKLPGPVEQQPESVQTPRSFLRRDGSELCVLCHDEPAGSLKGPHEPAGFAPAVRQALGLHPSVGACRACHTTHNAQGPHLWARAPAASPAGLVPNLCGACHGTGSVREPQETHHPLSIADSGSGSESGVTTLRIADSKGGDNPQSAIRNPKSGAVGCGSCHDPHGGPDVMALLRRPADSLCVECHEDEQGIKGSLHDPGASDWGKKLGFTSKGLCIDCHPIHGSREKAGIWASFPPDIARERPCEACHRAGAPGPAMETPHVGKLFDGKSESALGTNAKSEIRCTTCHNIHQQGSTAMLLRAPRQDSTLCLACHSEARGLPGTRHDLRLSAPEARNVRGETTAESGPCGSCHVVHPTGDKQGTWAHDATSEESFAGSHCTCCHAEGRCAARRVPAYVEHPRVPLFNRIAADDPNHMPTFDKHGELSRTGVISCPTCHELHTIASPPVVPGGASPPFDPHLRNTAHQRLCIDCHGIEALWRFLYYHKEHRNPYPKRNVSPPTVDAGDEAWTQ